MGGKNRAKKLASVNGSSTTKNKSSSIKVKNKASNKAKQRAGQKDAEARGKDVQSKKLAKSVEKAEKQQQRRSGSLKSKDGENAETRKKAKRSHGAKNTGGVSVKQQKQHQHESRAMSKHDAAYNQRQQEKADRLAGKLTPEEEAQRLRVREEADPQANEADERFFAQHTEMAGFLDNLNAEELTWGKNDKSKPQAKFPQPAPGTKKKTFDSDEDEEDDDDDDDDDDEDEDDDEDDSEDDAPKKKVKPSGSISSHERAPRRPSWATEKESKERLPIRNPDGSWGVSAITKYDTLKARAEKLEQQQKRQIGEPALESKESKAEDADDEEMNDAVELNGDDASDIEMDEDEDEQKENEEDEESDDGEQDGDEEEDEDEPFDDSIPFDMDDDLDGDLEMEDVSAEAPEEEEKVNENKLVEQQQRRQFRLKAELAESSELILENPEKNLGKLENMLQACQDVDLTIQQIALMSCVEVLIDLMPTYRIRLPTEEELEKNLSKETKATWKYERTYLLYYGRLVNLLLTYTRNVFPKQTNDRLDISQLGMNLIRCLAKLLEKGYAFNYRRELITGLTPFLNHVAPKIRLIVFQSLCAVFRADIAGDSTLEIVRILTKIVKEKGSRVQIELVQIFLYLPLHKEILEAKTTEEHSKRPEKGKKKKHIVVDERELSRDLAESEGVVSLAARKKIQTLLLTELFTAYFRILKQQKNSKLLPTVLKGLSKFATLIDIEIVLDLLDCLKATINPENEQPLSLESSLYCILTSFSTLQSHGQALQMDLKEFYNCLYGALFQFSSPDEVQHIPLLLQCLHLMFQETKQLSHERVGSFVKRLCTLCLYVPPHASLAIMHAVRLCLNKYPKVKQLLDREATASGLHLAEIDDPDLANSFASTAWELGLLKSSYHPFIPVYANSILEDETLPLSLGRIAPEELFQNYDSSEGGFNPPLPLPIMFANPNATAAATSTSMKKKLDLKRRILIQQLSSQQQNERFQSTFLQGVIKEYQQDQQSLKPSFPQPTPIDTPALKQRLSALRSLTQRYSQHHATKKRTHDKITNGAINHKTSGSTTQSKPSTSSTKSKEPPQKKLKQTR